MSRKATKRTMSARIVLTPSAYKAIEQAAFKNCRTVSQELSYRIECQIAGHSVVRTSSAAQPDKYDDPVQKSEPNSDSCVIPPMTNESWTDEQESEIAALGKSSGLSDGQLMALRIIHKTFDGVKAAIVSEGVPA